MVFISSKKYACETCIKGHRSSACKHTDRPLFEIKKKGRPVTQCEHCRELRKTKQVHVKCICELKSDNSTEPMSVRKGNNKTPESAAFPNGLPEALEASVARHLADGVSSDSDHGASSGCTCNKDGPCQCWKSKKNTHKSRRKTVPDLYSDPPRSLSRFAEQFNHPSKASSYILARMHELRPLVPRPPSNSSSGAGPVHQPSSGVAHGHINHHHELFNPYPRNHERAHVLSRDLAPRPELSTPPYPYDDRSYGGQYQMPDNSSKWIPPTSNMEIGTNSFPSACGCGDGCRCPGCVQHNGSNSVPPAAAFSSCMDPNSCGACLDCTILSLPANIPDTALSIYNTYQTEAIDEWIRQVSLPFASSSSQSSEDYLMPSGDRRQQSSPWPSDQEQDVDVFSGLNFSTNLGQSQSSDYKTDYMSSEMRDLSFDAPRRASNDMGRRSGQYVYLPDPSRSRSPSTSSQSSHDYPHTFHTRQGGGDPRSESYFGNATGVRSAPQLNVRTAVHSTASYNSSTSISPSPRGGKGSYPISNPGSFDEQYDPSLDRLRIY